MKAIKVVLIACIFFACSESNKGSKSKYQDYPISVVDIQDVIITDNFWLPKISTIQDSTIPYAFKKCEEEGRMDNFLIAGGKMEGKTKGKMPFDDSDVYKIIEGASNTLISKPNPKLDAYLDSVIDIIKVGQEPDGYITTWFTIDPLSPPAWWVEHPSVHRWYAEEKSHELYNSGHMFEAAAVHYLATSKRNFLDIALKNADLLVNNFGPDTLGIPPGHQIIETGLIKLYRITKNEKYLELAKFFLEKRGDSTTHKLYGAYAQDHIPVVEQHEAVGHAVRAVYMYAAMTDVATIFNDENYLNAVNNLWNNVVNKKMYLTGGIGSRHNSEAFGENYELPNLTAYNETCAAIGNVYWNQRMFLRSGNVKYYDIIERTLYNGLISGISTDGTKFFYPNPLEADGEYTFNQGACTRSPWFDCSCCPTNVTRFVPSISGLIYATNTDTLFVNLYMSNTASVKIKQQNIEVSQETAYPLNGKIAFNVNPENETSFTVKLRVPGWARNEVLPSNLYNYKNKIETSVTTLLNGEPVKTKLVNGYITLNREWHKGDKVEIEIPMQVRKVLANENIKDDRHKIAFEYGPIVYCAEETDNPEFDMATVTKESTFEVSETALLDNKINVLKNENLTLIPYYLWSNRGVNKMKVWIPLAE